MLLAEITEILWQAYGRLICGAEGCGVNDGTVGICDWCHAFVCLEHDDVLLNRDIDSDLVLCQPCGDEYDKEHKIEYDDTGMRKGEAHCYDCGIGEDRVC